MSDNLEIHIEALKENYNHYEFACPCGHSEHVFYLKDLQDADAHQCKKCETLYWWSPKQQKLYDDITQHPMSDNTMRLVLSAT